MFVKQISVFLENTKGGLARLTRLIGERGIDLIALSIADTEQFGILRCIVSDTERCAAQLREAGYTARITDVLAASVPDEPGGLYKVLDLLQEADVSVEYLYSFMRGAGGRALIILRVNDNARAVSALRAGNVELLDCDMVRAL